MDKAKVFVIMPFTEEFFESYEMIKRKLDTNYEFSNAGDIDNQQNILADIIQPICEADIILADLTGLNPNVMYELGIAHTFCKKTIVITRDSLSSLPFDLKQYRAKDYSTHYVKFDELIAYLEKNFKGAVDGTVLFSNPVKDFMDKAQIDLKQLITKSENKVVLSDGEKGYIDFIAEIEEDMSKMTSSIASMTSKQSEMSEGIIECTNEIERVNSIGGEGTASFVRKQARKAANIMSEYSKAIKECNEVLFPTWSSVENNIYGLLENQFSFLPENKASLATFLNVLIDTQAKIKEANKSINDMKTSAEGNMGIERSLTQATRFLVSDLNQYLNGTEGICNSIDRITAKSKLIIGDYTQQQI